jgi:RimJ/RimL family protein N-acetyltransferase
MTNLDDLAAPHFGQVAQWLSKSEINRWLTAEWRRTDISPTAIAIAVRNRRNRLFLVLHNGAPCGLAALSDIDTEDGTAMVWYLLGASDLAGRGIATAAVRAMAEIAFHRLGLNSLYAWAMEDNIASQRVLQKVGFREAGRIRQSAWSANRRVDRIYFDLLPDEILSPSGN